MKVNPEISPIPKWDTSRLATLYVARAARSISKLADAAFKPVGISFGQFPVLLMLNERTNMTQTELAAALTMEQPSMAELLGRMQRAGLITRTPDPADRRSSLVALTDLARERLSSAQVAFRQLDVHALKGFDETEITAFMAFLSRLTTNLRGMRDE